MIDLICRTFYPQNGDWKGHFDTLLYRGEDRAAAQEAFASRMWADNELAIWEEDKSRFTPRKGVASE